VLLELELEELMPTHKPKAEAVSLLLNPIQFTKEKEPLDKTLFSKKVSKFSNISRRKVAKNNNNAL